jgi:acyl-CoA dehydrogenase
VISDFDGRAAIDWGVYGAPETFLIDRDTPGLSVPRVDVSMGSTLHKLAEIEFDDCFVSDDTVVGEVGFGFLAAMKTLDDGSHADTRDAIRTLCVPCPARPLEAITGQFDPPTGSPLACTLC